MPIGAVLPEDTTAKPGPIKLFAAKVYNRRSDWLRGNPGGELLAVFDRRYIKRIRNLPEFNGCTSVAYVCGITAEGGSTTVDGKGSGAAILPTAFATFAVPSLPKPVARPICMSILGHSTEKRARRYQEHADGDP